MSSDQFSEKPLRVAGQKLCPHCGSSNPRRARKCWLCFKRFSESAVAADAHPQQQNRGADSQGRTVPQDRVTGAVLAIVAIVLFFVMLYEVPGILLIIAIVTAPFALKSVLGSRHGDRELDGENADRPATPDEDDRPSPLGVLLSSIGVVAVVGLTFIVTFWGTCFAVLFGGAAFANNTRTGGEFVVLLFFASIVLGVVVSIISTVTVANWLTRRRR